MKTLDSLTTEQIRKKFKNNFDLCNFSINIARNLLLSGQSMPLPQLLEIIGLRADEANLQNALKG
ncbi:MAG: hypothetical protein KGJ02_04720 [Verrucomicrobiota bacterium]|nr:hypothetical protein [Verrucomicrobiota bacterium]